MKYYECKTNIEKFDEEGHKVGNRFSYLVQADSCTRAEQLVKAEYENAVALVSVTDVVGRKFNELITDKCDAPELKFYKIVYTSTSLDDRRYIEIEKKETALVAAEKLTDATALFIDKFDMSIHKPVLLSVVETPIVEFIKDTNEETPAA